MIDIARLDNAGRERFRIIDGLTLWLEARESTDDVLGLMRLSELNREARAELASIVLEGIASRGSAGDIVHTDPGMDRFLRQQGVRLQSPDEYDVGAAVATHLATALPNLAVQLVPQLLATEISEVVRWRADMEDAFHALHAANQKLVNESLEVRSSRQAESLADKIVDDTKELYGELVDAYQAADLGTRVRGDLLEKGPVLTLSLLGGVTLMGGGFVAAYSGAVLGTVGLVCKSIIATIRDQKKVGERAADPSVRWLWDLRTRAT